MFKEGFLLGAATAAHQVEGNNTKNDIYAQECMKHGGYPVRSGLAANHYVTYRDDIRKMAEAGLNAYRFSLEWSRIEPQEGVIDHNEIEHYRDMIHACYENGIEPIVTLFHFTSPKWLIEKGGWESEVAIECFARYVEVVCEAYKNENLRYVCTINEANIGVLIAKYMRMAMEQSAKADNLQIGVDIEAMAREREEARLESLQVFHVENPAVFVSPRTAKGVNIVKQAHRKAVDIIHKMMPETKAGLSLSLRDVQWNEEGKEMAQACWEEEFSQFLDAIQDDDYFGLQNYTRCVFGKDGELPVPDGAEVTQMGYEFYPQGLENVLRRVSQEFKHEILVTENGIATSDDTRRVAFIKEALAGVKRCLDDGVSLIGYIYWTMIDNYEWQSGYSMQFGLMEMDEDHTPKPSLAVLGSYRG